LDEIRAALEKRGWRLTAELPGNGYNISATWQFERSGDPRTLLIDFSGLDDMETLPVKQSYGCDVRGRSVGLYFRRRGANDPKARERWLKELATFADAASGTPIS